MTERQISDGLCAYLRKEGIPFVRARTDKKSGIAEGWPDVTAILAGRVWLCELKTRTGKLSPKQEEVIAKIRAGGTQVTVARSVEEAVEAVRACFGIIDAPKPEKAATGRPALSEMTYPKLATNLFVANIFGTDYVMEGDSFPGGISKMVRRATTADYGIPRI